MLRKRDDESPDDEEDQRRIRESMAASRWSMTVLGILLLLFSAPDILLILQGKKSFWSPSSDAPFTLMVCCIATLDWIAWYDLRARQKKSDCGEEETPRYHFWGWRGTPRWLVALNLIFFLLSTAYFIAQPHLRRFSLAFLLLIAIIKGNEYLRWRTARRNSPQKR